MICVNFQYKYIRLVWFDVAESMTDDVMKNLFKDDISAVQECLKPIIPTLGHLLKFTNEFKSTVDVGPTPTNAFNGHKKPNQVLPTFHQRSLSTVTIRSPSSAVQPIPIPAPRLRFAVARSRSL